MSAPNVGAPSSGTPEGGVPDHGASGLPTVRPGWSAPAHVRVLCTTRAGGVSAAPYDSLNLGLHVGDDEADVRANRLLLVERLALPSAPFWLAQVHGTRVVRVGATGSDADASEGGGEGDGEDGDVVRGPVGEADGAWTDAPGRVVAVMTADCLPVVVTDAAGSRVAVAHAGWRGLAGGVLRSALAPFPEESELHAWLGPAIGPHAFEVGAEVREAFVGRDAAHEAAFVPRDAPGKYLADLYALARRELERDRPAGTVHVSGGDRCTLTEAACFHSHRRDGARSGRMGTLAWLTTGPLSRT